MLPILYKIIIMLYINSMHGTFLVLCQVPTRVCTNSPSLQTLKPKNLKTFCKKPRFLTALVDTGFLMLQLYLIYIYVYAEVTFIGISEIIGVFLDIRFIVTSNFDCDLLFNMYSFNVEFAFKGCCIIFFVQ